jgi:GMP synthase-like glutamine amidotransferase
MKKIGLLETGNPPGDLAETYGSYSAMFEALLGPDGHSYRVYDVEKGELPADPAENDAYLITGSAAGVYDPLPWIEPLKAFLREAKGEHADGRGVLRPPDHGRGVRRQGEKSDKGWGVGLQAYEVVSREPWMDAAEHVAVPGSHQDQVTSCRPARGCWQAARSRPTAFLRTMTPRRSRCSSTPNSRQPTPRR